MGFIAVLAVAGSLNALTIVESAQSGMYLF